MKYAWGWLGLGTALWLGGGCGKSEAGGPVPREEFARRFAQLRCEGLGSCCKRQGFPFDAARCQALFTLEAQEDLDDQDDPAVAYDGEAAAECFASFPTECKDHPDSADPACGRVFAGTLTPGAPCSNDSQCRAPEGGYASCVGVCRVGAPVEHGKLGEHCSYSCPSGDSCLGPPGDPPAVGCYKSEGLHCSQAGLQPTCQPLAAIGQPCELEGCAGDDTFCSFADATCSAPLGEGRPCGGDWECQSRNCDEGTQVCTLGTVTAGFCALQ